MRGGQLYCQSYWHDLLKIIEKGGKRSLHFYVPLTQSTLLGSRSNFHRHTYHGTITRLVICLLHIDRSILVIYLGAEAYKMFDEKSDGTM